MASEYVTPTQFAEEVGRTRQNIYQWIATRRIASIRVGGQIVIPRSELTRVRDNLKQELPIATGLTLQGV